MAQSKALLAVAAIAVACGSSSSGAPPAAPVAIEAGFVEIPPRDVVVKGAPVHIEATARLFYNLVPATNDPENRPIFFLSNGFAAEVVRAFGTGPKTVADGGAVVDNPTPFTSFANLVYLEPRQAGYSYDLLPGGTPGSADCAPSLFNEYVDAADVALGAIAFLDAHPGLHGPVFWVGESYAGVRLTWILTYLRGQWGNAPYEDATLADAIARVAPHRSLRAGQILLEGWVAGGAHANAIAAECTAPDVLAGVSTSIGASCGGTDACACAGENDRSAYNYTYSVEHETARETEASEAHIDPEKAAALLGVPLTSIPLLAAAERAKGFRCSPPDATLPSEDALVAALGPLPAGQAYYVNYSPLLPGKEQAPATLDWRTSNLEGIAFLDNVRDVPTFLTAGPRDLVVPPGALAPALRAIAGAGAIDDSAPDRLGVVFSDGERVLPRFTYPEAGHMVEMSAPAQLAADVEAWVRMTSPN
ncbi:MAG TPA: hypothetical protein VGI39_43300 [Polyangiaceae bacterium]